MAKCVITANLPPLIDPTRTPLAYGDRALPRLNEELNNSSLLLRQRALRSLSDYLHDPENIVAAIGHGIMINVKQLLGDLNETVRQLATECLYIIASHGTGKEAFISYGIIKPLALRFDDSDEIVRVNTHTAFKNLSETAPGAEAIVGEKLVSILVNKLNNELDAIKCLILDTLHFLLHINAEVALENKAMQIFTHLLTHDESEIRGKAARDIMDLSVTRDGKEKAVECGTMTPLVQLLKDSDRFVRANAAGAIMFITITTKGKYTALGCAALEPLVELINDITSEVRLNAIKALTCLAETPEGRKELLQHVDMVRSHERDAVPIVVKAAKRAVEVITWLPGNPYYPRID